MTTEAGNLPQTGAMSTSTVKGWWCGDCRLIARMISSEQDMKNESV